MRRAAQRDRNEPDIRQRAEALGYLWLPNNVEGRPDACLLRAGATCWCEVKVPGEPYTEAQMREFARMRAAGVPVYPLERPEDVDRLRAGTLPAWTGEGVPVWSAAGGRTTTGRKYTPGKSRAQRVEDLCATDCCPTSKAPGSRWCIACGKVAPAPGT